ncbi:hypothetical protein [Immundisolibacter sp.]|uniref:hypothetical protein n=1 Tax=Immundisolibacter sp. TaxID=1934948 RepID=UPI0025BACF92|nr:hypothetical protein [Immundisolibacter sp.]
MCRRYRAIVTDVRASLAQMLVEFGCRTDLSSKNVKKPCLRVLTLHHAEAILKHDMPEAVTELEEVLAAVVIPVEELLRLKFQVQHPAAGKVLRWERRTAI